MGPGGENYGGEKDSKTMEKKLVQGSPVRLLNGCCHKICTTSWLRKGRTCEKREGEDRTRSEKPIIRLKIYSRGLVESATCLGQLGTKIERVKEGRGSGFGRGGLGDTSTFPDQRCRTGERGVGKKKSLPRKSESNLQGRGTGGKGKRRPGGPFDTVTFVRVSRPQQQGSKNAEGEHSC